MRHMTFEEKQYVEHVVSNESKSLIVAYILWIFLGYFGAHRFYLGKTISGVLMILLTLVCGLLTLITFGVISPVTMFPVALWWLIDAILIIFMVNNYNKRVRTRAFRLLRR